MPTPRRFDSEMRVLARKTKDILTRYKSLQIRHKELETQNERLRSRNVEIEDATRRSVRAVYLTKIEDLEIARRKDERERSTLEHALKVAKAELAEKREAAEKAAPANADDAVARLKREMQSLRERLDAEKLAKERAIDEFESRDKEYNEARSVEDRENIVSRLNELLAQLKANSEMATHAGASPINAATVELFLEKRKAEEKISEMEAAAQRRQEIAEEDQRKIAMRLQSLLEAYDLARMKRNEAISTAQECEAEAMKLRQSEAELKALLSRERDEAALSRETVREAQIECAAFSERYVGALEDDENVPPPGKNCEGDDAKKSGLRDVRRLLISKQRQIDSGRAQIAKLLSMMGQV